MNQLDVSLIIVNYNTRDYLRQCIESVYEYTKENTFELVVVDNASSDGSADMVENLFPDVCLVRLNENVGFGRANNIGAKHATGRYLFLLNSDTIMIHDAISDLVAFMDSTDHCGICGGNLIDLDGNPIHSFEKRLPSPVDEFRKFMPNRISNTLGVRNEFNFSNIPVLVGYVTGADLLIRADLFMSLNGFNPGFFMYYEETELTYRVKKLGYSIFSVPDARIIHIKGGSLSQLNGAKEMIFDSKYLYMSLVYGGWAVVVTHILFSLHSIFKAVLQFILGKRIKAQLAIDKVRLANTSFKNRMRNLHEKDTAPDIL